MNYPERGCDYHGYPPHEAPGQLTPREVQIFTIIEEELARQGFESRTGAYVCFRKDDNQCRLEGNFSISKIAEKIGQYLEAEEKKNL